MTDQKNSESGERRRTDRANIRTYFYFQTQGRRHEVGEIVTKNISESGMLLIHREPILEGTILDIELDLHDGTPPEMISAKVTRCEHPFKDVSIYALGVEFTRISDEMHAALCNFIGDHSDDDALEDLKSYLLHHYREEIEEGLRHIQLWNRDVDTESD